MPKHSSPLGVLNRRLKPPGSVEGVRGHHHDLRTGPAGLRGPLGKVRSPIMLAEGLKRQDHVAQHRRIGQPRVLVDSRQPRQSILKTSQASSNRASVTR